MAKKKRPYSKLQCQQCKRVNYYVHKSKKLRDEKLELKKFCNWCKKHTPHKESKR